MSSASLPPKTRAPSSSAWPQACRQAGRLTQHLGILLGLTILAGCQSVSAGRQVELAIEDATVIDPETQRVLPRHSVYVDRGRIVAVKRSGWKTGYVGRQRVEGRGRFLIPGLMDMHAHLFLPENPTPTLNLLLANGVTGIREMSSDCWSEAGVTEGCISDYRRLQSDLRSGLVPGPELLGLTSPMIMGPSRLKRPEGTPSFVTPVTAEEGKLALVALSSRGADLIKTHDSIPDPAFRGLMEEAGRRNIRVGGHIPFRAGSIGAAELGYASIEHARDLLYDCSRFGPEYRRREADFAEAVTGAKRPQNLERLTRTVSEFDAGRCADVLRTLAATGIFYVPTHVTREMEALADDPAYRADKARQYVTRERDARWEADLNETAGLPVSERAALAAFYRHGLRITGMAHQAGIPIMAGTDLNDTMITPGFSMHRELRLLNAAGLSNMAVLRSATTVPAVYLHRTHDLGGISVGKQADMVLLRADPLAAIENTRAIDSVILDGRLFTRRELEKLLEQAQLAVARK